MKKNERSEYILKLAYDLANTGKFESWMQIELKIRSDGFPQARQVLDSRFVREELNSICKSLK